MYPGWEGGTSTRGSMGPCIWSPGPVIWSPGPVVVRAMLVITESGPVLRLILRLGPEWSRNGSKNGLRMGPRMGQDW